MALAGGFNPETGTFENLKPVLSIPHNTGRRNSGMPSLSYAENYRPRRSLWSLFNNGVAYIGNWIAHKSDNIIGWCSMALIIAMVLGGIAIVISTWISDGFWIALIATIGVCVVGAFVWYIAVGLIAILVNILVYGLRLLFWNGWTLLVSLALVVGIWLYNSESNAGMDSFPEEVSIVVDDYFRCTAKVLNVRATPSKNGKILGVLKKGDEVAVNSIENGFAEIEYNGTKAYVSELYLERLD